MKRWEIQVLVADDSTSPMTRVDRCTLDAENLQAAAAAYAALFSSEQARIRPVTYTLSQVKKLIAYAEERGLQPRFIEIGPG